MEESVCGFCGAGMVRKKQVVKQILPRQKEGMKRRRPRKDIPRIVREVLYCQACDERMDQENRNRNTPGKWLAYVNKNPRYFEVTFGAQADPGTVCRQLLGRNGFSDIKRQKNRKHRRIYVQVAAL